MDLIGLTSVVGLLRDPDEISSRTQANTIPALRQHAPLILFVEDDGLLQADGEMMLGDAGYEVAIAASGADACVLLERHCEQVSALLTDINLHGPMSGWQVAQAARRLNPGLPVLYVSASEQADFDACRVSGSRWVSKPFAWSEVTQTIAELVRA